MSTTWFATGVIAAGLGVVLGAFATHSLESRVEPRLLANFETGVRYQMYHALALLAVAWASQRFLHPAVNIAGWAFVVGIIVFSGSLYVMALTGARWLGALTPVGGLAFILGWTALAIAALKS